MQRGLITNTGAVGQQGGVAAIELQSPPAPTYQIRSMQNSANLLKILKYGGIKHSDYTKNLIKEKLTEDADCESATTCIHVSLVCPLSQTRMTTPCRAITCEHLQCFDASLFLQMNERKPTWKCPVCGKPAVYKNLVIDGYFQDVLTSTTLPADTNEIQLHKDGSWSTKLVVQKEVENLDESVQIIEDYVITVFPNNNDPSASINMSMVDLTLSDSEDEQPAKRKTPPKPDSTNTFNGQESEKRRVE